MTTIATKSNPHRWFFAYTKTLEGYDKTYEKVIREGIVYDYSGGKTSSLKELYEKYPSKYIQMQRKLQFEQLDETDKARKRLIAVLFSFCLFKGYKADMAYVKKVACNATGCDRFNDIQPIKLRELYRIFGDMHSKAADKWVTATLTNITEEASDGTAKH